jgi:general secretion pathway protein B
MSFILDALRRADRERESERGSVPSLHTQAVPPSTANTPPDDDAPRPWLWLAAGLGGGLVLAAVWALWSATPTAAPPMPAAAPSPAPQTPAPQAAVAPPAQVATAPSAPTVAASTIAPAAPVTVAEPRAATAPSRDAKPPAPLAEPRRSTPAAGRDNPTSTRAPEPAPASRTQATVAPPAPAVRAETSQAPVASTPRPRDEPVAASAPAAGPPIRQLGQLSAEERSSLPTLAIGGAMYSANAASRRLIVNGQLLREGEAVAPGVTLEEIRLKSAVLRTKDLRYELGF